VEGNGTEACRIVGKGPDRQERPAKGNQKRKVRVGEGMLSSGSAEKGKDRTNGQEREPRAALSLDAWQKGNSGLARTLQRAGPGVRLIEGDIFDSRKAVQRVTTLRWAKGRWQREKP